MKGRSKGEGGRFGKTIKKKPMTTSQTNKNLFDGGFVCDVVGFFLIPSLALRRATHKGINEK